MEHVTLRGSDAETSRIGFGCAAISGHDYGRVDEDEFIDAIRVAWELGVTLFDTSNVYGFGYAERVLAKALGKNRHEATIVTKFGIKWDQAGRTYRDCSVREMRAALEDSLSRLKVDCIPIYMVHWHDGVTPVPKIMDALGQCQRQGKIRYVGCSNFTSPMILQAFGVLTIDFIQLPYSLVRREHESQLVESAGHLKMSTMAYDVLARGLLSGKYDRDVRFGDEDTRTGDRYFSGPSFESNLQMVECLRVIGRRHRKTPAQVAIRWALGQPHIHHVLVGSKDRSQVVENTGVFGWGLTVEDQFELEQAGMS